MKGDGPKVYKILWLDGGEDSVEFDNIWGRDEVCGDVGMDIRKDKFCAVVGKEDAMEVEFEFWYIDVGIICMCFEGVGQMVICM